MSAASTLTEREGVAVRFSSLRRLEGMGKTKKVADSWLLQLEVLPHAAYDPLLFDWHLIAATAWSGYLASGEGHVAIHVGAEVRFEYRPGAPCECHGELIGEYDPEQQVVIVVHIGACEQVHCLAGWPTPPEAYASVDAASLDAVVH